MPGSEQCRFLSPSLQSRCHFAEGLNISWISGSSEGRPRLLVIQLGLFPQHQSCETGDRDQVYSCIETGIRSFTSWVTDFLLQPTFTFRALGYMHCYFGFIFGAVLCSSPCLSTFSLLCFRLMLCFLYGCKPLKPFLQQSRKYIKIHDFFLNRNRLKASSAVESVDLPDCHLIKGIGKHEKLLVIHLTLVGHQHSETL